MQNDTKYHKELLSKLKFSLSSDYPWKYLLIGTEDPEIVEGYTEADKHYVILKARHIYGALHLMNKYALVGRPCTRNDCCEKAKEF